MPWSRYTEVPPPPPPPPPEGQDKVLILMANKSKLNLLLITVNHENNTHTHTTVYALHPVCIKETFSPSGNARGMCRGGAAPVAVCRRNTQMCSFVTVINNNILIQKHSTTMTSFLKTMKS